MGENEGVRDSMKLLDELRSKVAGLIDLSTHTTEELVKKTEEKDDEVERDYFLKQFRGELVTSSEKNVMKNLIIFMEPLNDEEIIVGGKDYGEILVVGRDDLKVRERIK